MRAQRSSRLGVWFKLSGVMMTSVCLYACSLDNITDLAGDNIIGGEIPREALETYEGARFVYFGAVVGFHRYVAEEALAVARFTDELTLLPGYQQHIYDDRIGREGSELMDYVVSKEPYNTAQRTKVQFEQALQLLESFGDSTAVNLKANAYGLLGMLHVMLADNYCSGIPLSVSLWGGKVELGGSFSTDSLYQIAISQFDKGLDLRPDSSEINTLLLVGKARALNALGKYKEAFDITSEIQQSDSVYIYYPAWGASIDAGATIPRYTVLSDTSRYTIRNGKGGNGVSWIAESALEQDERIKVQMRTAEDYALPFKPAYFSTDVNLTIAGWSEAGLIAAEYYLSINDIPSFINSINQVRRKYRTYSGVSLSDTTDPGSRDSRVRLLFRERAYTNFMTGRRLGDMRRLIRQYAYGPDEVFPVGLSEGTLATSYGSNYVFAPESSESGLNSEGRETRYNHLYNGCDSYEP